MAVCYSFGMDSELAVILHGGAGNISPIGSPEQEEPFLRQALDAAWSVLTAGGSSDAAVVAALTVLEDCEYFDAGYGGFPNEFGQVLLDVGLMRGCGDFTSLVNLSQVRFPSQLALAGFDPGTQLMRVWTDKLGLRLQDSSADFKKRIGYCSNPADLVSEYAAQVVEYYRAKQRQVPEQGTVGCLARDIRGELCAGTSTGGTPGKPEGRIGDSPIIGAGVFAGNDSCALSATGHGESILQTMVSGHVISRIRQAIRNPNDDFSNRTELLQALLNEELDEFRRLAPGKPCGLIVLPVRGDPAYCFRAQMMGVAVRVGSPVQVRREYVKAEM